MTRNFRIPLAAFFCTAGFAAFGAAPPNQAVYVNGTVDAVAAATEGILKWSEGKQLRYEYGASTLAIPYDSIVSVKVGGSPDPDRESNPLAATARGVASLPKFFSRNKKHYLSVKFKGAEDTEQTMVLEVSKALARRALPAIQARMHPADLNVAAAQGTAPPDDAWWGNRYWRTSRNSEKWNQQEAKSGSTAKPKPAE